MSIYKAKTKDLNAILFVINESNREKYKTIIPPDYFKEPVLTTEEISELFNKMTFFMYKLNDAIVGVGALDVKDEELAEIHWVYVLPKFQNKGIGTALMNHLETEAHNKKLGILQVPTSMRAYWARNFYVKLGYRLIEERETPEGGIALFEKRLIEK